MNPQIVEQVVERRRAKKAEQARLTELKEQMLLSEMNREATLRSMRKLIEYLEQKQLPVEVTNQLERVVADVPELSGVLDSINKLNITTLSKELDTSQLEAKLTTLLKAVEKLPTSYPTPPKPADTMKVSNLSEISRKIEELSRRLQNLPKPEVNVAAPNVTVETDELKEKLTDVLKAIKDIKIPSLPSIPETDLEPVKKGLDKVEDAIKELIAKPVPVFTPAPLQGIGNGFPRNLTAVISEETGEWVLAVANADGSMITGGGGGGVVSSLYGSGEYGTAEYA